MILENSVMFFILRVTSRHPRLYKNLTCEKKSLRLSGIIISAGTATTLYGDTPHFDCSNFPSRGSSYHVNSGGWVVYSEPHYQGKIIIHFAGKLLYYYYSFSKLFIIYNLLWPWLSISCGWAVPSLDQLKLATDWLYACYSLIRVL